MKLHLLQKKRWNDIQYFVIEYCAPDDSALSADSEYSKKGLMLRCAKEDDVTKQSSIDAIKRFIEWLPPRAVVISWSSIPCAGGSSAQNANAKREKRFQNLVYHCKLWRVLLVKFVELAIVVLQRLGRLAIEWPLSCRCWKTRAVKQLLSLPIWFDARIAGCAYGLTVPSGCHAG